MIEVKNIDFSYKKGVKTIDNLSFSVPRGTIFGFLGANGSGKTTTIRLLLNLCTPERGAIKIDGHLIDRNSSEIFSRIGTLIEGPVYYAHLSGEENMKVFASYYDVSDHRVTEVLHLVDLIYAKDKKVGSYSLGMKQRLGLGISLLQNPDLLILDEPLNGLDPKGIAEVRDLLIRLQKEEGKTIMISSHILSEIESTCNSICIIEKGRKLFSGEIEELRSSIMNQQKYGLTCNDPGRASQIIEQFFPLTTSRHETLVTFSTEDKELIPDVIHKLIENKVRIYAISPQENKLEELYLKLTYDYTHAV